MSSAQTSHVRIDADVTLQEFHGWGTSLAWFANRTGSWHSRDELADLLFAPPGVSVSLGLTIARYDIGGGDHPAHAGKMRLGADVPSWRPNPDDDYDWSADGRQRWWLQAAACRAGKAFIADAISYSAPWWMTKSGRSNGYLDGTVDNLKPGREADFAAYLADVIQHIERCDGIRFRALSPLNEPGTAYWTDQTRQEGMRVSPGSPQRRILDATFLALRERALETGLSAVDETGIDLSISALHALGEAGFAWDRIDQINVHSYLSGDRGALHDLAVRSVGKRLQMSEVTIDGGPYAPDSIEPSLAWAAHLTQDLKELRPSEYVYWQAIEAESDAIAGNGNWGFLHDRSGVDESYSVTRKFHAMRQYSNFVRPGSTIIQSSSPRALAAINPCNGPIVIVMYNQSASAENVEFDIAGAPNLFSSAIVYRTSQTEERAVIGRVPVRGARISFTLSARSITTFVVERTSGDRVDAATTNDVSR